MKMIIIVWIKILNVDNDYHSSDNLMVKQNKTRKQQHCILYEMEKIIKINSDTPKLHYGPT